MPPAHPLARTATLFLCALLSATTSSAQSPAAVPKLNLEQFTVNWYEIARLPNRQEKPCSANNALLYALDDKKNTFEFVISCVMKADNWNSWNYAGKLDPAGSGQLRLKHFWPYFNFSPFTSRYVVLAMAPDGHSMVTGTPNHKSLWLLSRTRTLPPATLDAMKSVAAAQGFNTAKLLMVPQHDTELEVTSSSLPATATPAQPAAPATPMSPPPQPR